MIVACEQTCSRYLPAGHMRAILARFIDSAANNPSVMASIRAPA